MKYFILLSVLFLTACGFTPVYKGGAGQQQNVSSALSNIDIAIVKDREGQFLRNALIDRFYRNGYPSNPQYRLVTNDIEETISDFDITIDSEATRQLIKLTTSMQLIDLQTNKAVLNRTLVATTSNNVLESEFSTLVTEQAAREAALNDLARQIERQVALYFAK